MGYNSLTKTHLNTSRTANCSACSHKYSQIKCVFVTASGSVLKAVNYNGKMVIIEEVQLFKHSEPVKILRLSTTTVSLRISEYLHLIFSSLKLHQKFI